MGALPGFFKVILRAPDDYFLLEGDIFIQYLPQIEYPGLCLVVDQGKHDYRECGLERRLGKELVEHHLGVRVSLQLDDHAHAVSVRLVSQIAYTVKTLIFDLLGDILYELALVHLIGQLCHYYAGAVVLAELLKIRLCADCYLSAPGGIRRADTASPHYDASCGKIRSLNMLHQVAEVRLGVIQNADAGVDHLPQIMGRDIRRHTNCNTAGTVNKKVRESAGQYSGFLTALVKVGVPVHRVLVYVPEHLV